MNRTEKSSKFNWGRSKAQKNVNISMNHNADYFEQFTFGKLYRFKSVLEYLKELNELTMFKNRLSVAIKAKLHKYPIKTIMKKNNRFLILYNPNHLQMIKAGMDVDYITPGNYFMLKYRGRNLIFYGAEHNGDLPGIFHFEEYSSIDIAGKTILDIGANIGDSSLWFSLNGAKKVVAVEPDNYAFNYLLKNITVNEIQNIVAINAALGIKKGKVEQTKNPRIPTTLNDSYNFILDSVNGNLNVIALRDLAEAYEGERLVVKVDCEGCEYNIFRLHESIPLNIQEIFLEYHHGAGPLKGILEENGFNFEIIKEWHSYVRDAMEPNRLMGYLHALRKVNDQ